MSIVNDTLKAIEQASLGLKFILPDEVAGWCPTELGSALGTLLLSGQRKYLEVGTFCGRSLIYALRTNKQTKAWVIDPLLNSMIVGISPVYTHWENNVHKYEIWDQVTLYRERIEHFQGEIKDIDIAFVDGNHDSGHTYEALKKVQNYLADEAIIIVDDYEIYGGGAQTPYPGYEIDIKAPVKTDVHKFLAETPEVTVIAYTPWLNSQIYLHFRRSK